MISVIVPIYNQQAYLKRCIDSILNQSYQDIELILIDDGSTDLSGSMCDSYKKVDKRIIVIHKQNGGLSDARNVGIQHAKGEFLCFIDSDDYVPSYMLEVLYRNALKYNADLSIGNYWWVNENDDIIENVKNEKIEVYQNEEIDRLLLWNDFEYQWGIVTSCNKLFKREIFDNCRYAKGKVHEDELIIHHLLDKVKILVYSNIKTYYYIKHEESIMGKINDRRIYDAIDAYYDRIMFWEGCGKKELVKALVAQLIYIYKGYYYEIDYEKIESADSVRKYMRWFYRKLAFYNYVYKNISVRSFIQNWVWGINPYFYEVYERIKKKWSGN